MKHFELSLILTNWDKMSPLSFPTYNPPPSIPLQGVRGLRTTYHEYMVGELCPHIFYMLHKDLWVSIGNINTDVFNPRNTFKYLAHFGEVWFTDSGAHCKVLEMIR